MPYLPLDRYSAIGNLTTIALISTEGSVDWLPFPHLMDASLFAAIVDEKNGGRFAITPVADYQSRQEYESATAIVRTAFTTDKGRALLTDWMPPITIAADRRVHGSHELIRTLVCEEGTFHAIILLDPRPNFAREAPTLLQRSSRSIEVRSTSMTVFVHASTSVPWTIEESTMVASIELTKGQRLSLILTDADSAPADTDAYAKQSLQRTRSYWKTWVELCERNICDFSGSWHEQIVRSAITLKLLTYGPTGAIAAAATTSIPEHIGGARNWDYRYTWIRDTAYTLKALYQFGKRSEALRYFNWIVELCGNEHPRHLQIMYGLNGKHTLTEQRLDHLEGYEQSAPVRIGNDAYNQQQHDVYGELLDAAWFVSEQEGIDPHIWGYLRSIVNYVCDIWQEPDDGLWEARVGKRQYVHSKLWCWVALDRGIKLAQRHGYDAPITTWEQTAHAIRTDILEYGFDTTLQSFTQAYDVPAIDASALAIPLTGFLPADDPRVASTIRSIEQQLMTPEGFIIRYHNADGIEGQDHPFLLCSFWYIEYLIMAKRENEAHRFFQRLMECASPLGLYSEEYDPSAQRLLGNFPQAFTHIGFIRSAYLLREYRVNTKQ